MKQHIFTGSLILGLACWVMAPRAEAQGPTIEPILPSAPGAANSMLGVSPGSGGADLGDNPGGSGQVLGGRPGASTPRVPTTVTNPSASSPTSLQMGITAPKPQPTPTVPFYGSLSLPSVLEDEGPPQGMTLDMAIDRALRENLDLRAKFYEIPQAQADILQAGLRANPIFYADGQLVPYGQYNRASPGGPTQYDVNISYPLDVSRKRQARTLVATRAKRVLEALYQDAVRMRIDEVYLAFIDVLAARQTIRYANKSVEGLERLLGVEQKRYQQDVTTRAEVKRVEITRDQAQIGLIDAEEQYRKTKRALAGLLNLPPADADSLEVRGSIFDKFSPPPQLEELYRIALGVRPDVVSFRLGIQRAEADVRLALANRFSDVYVLYQPYTFQNNQPFGLKSPTSWALGVTVPLPIYNRNQGGIQRAKLNVTQTQIQLASVERQVMTEVAQAYQEYQNSLIMVRRMEENVLPDAETVLNDSYRLYQGGEKDVTYYLNAQRDYNDVVKQYLDTMVRHRRSMLALNTVLGQRILP
jgi:cobalt-zinc-cadmium efflux system outer membrane protein